MEFMSIKFVDNLRAYLIYSLRNKAGNRRILFVKEIKWKLETCLFLLFYLNFVSTNLKTKYETLLALWSWKYNFLKNMLHPF